MPLDPVVLDTLRWDELVEATRRRIAAVSDGQWTLHAPVDPGITLLELFAALLEQQSYWLDQVSDDLVLGLARLLGIAPARARAARTVLALASEESPARLRPEPPRGTVLADETGGSFLTTLTALRILPVVAATAARRGRAPNAAHAIDVLFGDGALPAHLDGAPAIPASTKVVIWLAKPMPFVGNAARYPVSLLVELDDGDRVLPHWHPDSVRVPAPARVRWLYETAAGFQPAHVTNDGTSGLRRSGLVQLSIPEGWVRHTIAVAGRTGTPYALKLELDPARYAFPPRLRRVVPNAAIAADYRRVLDERHAVAWLPLPDQQLRLRQDHDIASDADRPIPHSVRLRLLESASGWQDWHATNSLAGASRAERVFAVDREHAVLRFGNGITGRQPRPALDTGLENIRVRYRLGGGAAANQPRLRRWRHDAMAITAWNIVPAAGGRDPESIANLRRRVAAEMRKPDRAVTPNDYRRLIPELEGVAIRRVHVALGKHPAHPCRTVPGALTLFLVPDAPRGEADFARPDFVRAPVPDQAVLAHVRAHLEQWRLLTTEVYVRAAAYRAVELAIEIESDPRASDRLRPRIELALRRHLDPLVGGDAGSGFEFGAPLRPTALLRIVQREVEDDGVATSVGIRLDSAGLFEDCHDVKINAHELVFAARIDVRIRPPTRKGGLA